jgi:polysaccharide biosynthesis/export protein
MIKLFLSLSLVLILTACSTPSPMDIPANFMPVSATAPKVTTNPEALIEFQTDLFAEDEQITNYLIGAGDELIVDIWGYPELSGSHIVGPDGVITLALAGNFKVAELSREQAAENIRERLTSTYYNNLAVTVRVNKYNSNRILVLGKVQKPGEIKFGMSAPTLLEAISLAGGLASSRSALLPTDDLPFTRAAVFRESDKIVWVDLQPLLMGEDLNLNLKLRRNDIVYVPEATEKLVYVLGAVNRPGAFPLTAHASFLEMLAKAGGPSREAAPSRINIIRPNEKINTAINLNDLFDGNNRVNISLQENDIIYVPTNALAHVNYAFGFLSPFSQILGIYADIESIRANRNLRAIDSENERLIADKERLEAERDLLNQTREELERNNILE